MAKNDREVEVRVSSFSRSLSRLKKFGLEPGPKVVQNDTVYKMPPISGREQSSWLRLRIENDDTCTFTLKKAMTNSLDCMEHETKVADPEQMELAMKAMGATLHANVRKTRTKARSAGIEICLDQVDRLGNFVEAEVLIEKDDDPAEVLDQMKNLLRDIFGEMLGEEITVGYDQLLNKLNQEAGKQ